MDVNAESVVQLV